MRTKRSLISGCLLAIGLASLSPTAHTQDIIAGTDDGHIVQLAAINGEFAQGHAVGAGTSSGGVFVGFAQPNFGALVLAASDTNQDGAATAEELKTTVLGWFENAATAAKGVFTLSELANALKQGFPAPQPPEGIPAPPEEHRLHHILAQKFMGKADSNQDGSLTSQEALAYVNTNFAAWDADSSNWLSTVELVTALRDVLPTPSVRGGFGSGQGVPSITE